MSDRIISYVHDRVHKKNKNFICMFVGPTGSGKTYSALRFAEKVDPDFDIRNVVFKAEDFMELLNGSTKKLKQGSVILFDEMQITMSNMEFNSFIAKALNYVLTTFRHRNLILICTAPYLSIVNATARKLFHAVFEMQKIDQNEGVAVSKPLFIQVNPRTGKSYYKYLRIRSEFGLSPISRYSCQLPKQKLLEAYEIEKTKFTDSLNSEIMEMIEEKNLEKIKKRQRAKESVELTPRQSKVFELLKKGMTQTEISQETGYHTGNISNVIKSIKRKGYNIEKVFVRKDSQCSYIVHDKV